MLSPMSTLNSPDSLGGVLRGDAACDQEANWAAGLNNAIILHYAKHPIGHV